MHQDIDKILLSQEEIELKSAELARQLKVDYEDKQPILLGLLKGSTMFMADLMKHLDIDLQIDFMDVSSYHGTSSTGDVKIVKDLDLSVRGRHVLIAEDIVDTGRTLEKVIELLKHRGAITVEMVTMLDKPEARIAPITAKYIGFTIPKAFVVGYGLDYNEKYRNLPYIGILKQAVYLENE
ncbi:MAG: hypoxanthine phosphoribosyltransferase [Defluviitaleaceae bacterium]|nr:hypoxanthine phosphoribosyltransferase [Defluviitaleaceae bacterium]